MTCRTRIDQNAAARETKPNITRLTDARSEKEAKESVERNPVPHADEHGDHDAVVHKPWNRRPRR